MAAIMRMLVAIATGLLLMAATVNAQPLSAESLAEARSFATSPAGQELQAISVRLDRAFAPLCSVQTMPRGMVAGGVSRCAPVPVVTTRRGMRSVDEHNGNWTGLFSDGLEAFEGESQRAALLAQHAAFAILWERSAGHVFTSARRNYFSAGDAQQADAAALAALSVAGFDPEAYLPVLLKLKVMQDARPVAGVYHNSIQPGLLSTVSEVSEERRQSIERGVAALKTGGFAAYLAGIKAPAAGSIAAMLVVPAALSSGQPASADLRDAASVPYLKTSEARAAYERWLERPLPRAFVIHPGGHWHAVSGRRDAGDQALRSCTEKWGAGCALYALDNSLVWRDKPDQSVKEPAKP